MQSITRSSMKFVAIIGVLFLLSALPAAAQTSTGAIHGTITDQSGALLPGVNVTTRNVATNLERNTTSDQDGFYQFLFLPVGTYEITAEATGFRRDIRQGIELQINQKARIDITLQVGDLAQEVIVTSAPPLVETSSSAVGDVIENARIVGMPLNGRNFQQLALLTAGTAPAQEGSTTEFFGTACGSIGIAVNGGRDDQNNMLIDGIVAIDHYFNILSLCPSVDAVQEFKVLKNSYNADFGMFGSGQIIATIKSGSNQFHGNVFEFHRNHAFSAKNFFDFKDRDIPIFVQNQFGGTLGGPIQQDKTFFFFSFEALRVSQSETRRSALPTVDQRAGLFVGELFDSELLTSSFPFTYTGAAGCETDALVDCTSTTIPAVRFGTVANAMLALIPVPNSPGALGFNHVSVDKRAEERDQVIFRLDHQFSPNHLFFGRYIWARADQSQPFGDNILTFDPPPPPGFPTPVIDDSQNLAFGLTSILGSSLVNEFRGGWNFFEGSRLGGNTQIDFATDILGLDPAALGLTAELPAAPIDRGYPNFHVAGLSQFGDGDVFNPLIRTNNSFQFSDDLAWTVGKHSFKFGGTVHFVGFDTLSNFFARGFPNYDAVSLTGNFTADFLIDRPFAIVRTRGDTSGEFSTSLWGVYFTDSFRASSRLTINYGVRYEVFPPITEKNNRLSLYDKNTQSIVIAGDTLPPEVTAAGGLADLYNTQVIPFLPPFTLGPVNYVTGASLGLGRSLTKTDWKNWAPRLGLAYDLTGSGKTVVRASFGIYNALRDWSASSDSRNMLPFSQQMVLVDLNRLPGLGFLPPITFQDMFTGVGNVGGSGIGPQIDMPIGYFEQYGLTIQHQLADNFVIEVAYTGTHGINLNRLTTTNQEQLITGPLSGTPPNRQFGFFIQEASDATSSYQGGFIRVEKRISNGLMFVSSFTYSKAIDTVSSARENGGAPTREQDAFCLICEKALSNFDTRKRFVTSFTYELPLGRGATGAAEKLLQGWQIAGIVSAQSGQPFTPQYPGGAGAGFRFPRPSQDCDPNLSSGQQTPNRWFNTTCFFAPSVLFDALANGALTVEHGTSGRNTLEGPGLGTVDINFSKTTPLGEQANIEFRAEFFNLLNRANFNLPDRVFVPSCLAFFGDTTCRNINPNFGQISSAKSARIIQFGLKVTF